MEIKRLRPECLSCLGKKYMDKYPETATDAEKLEYTRRTLRILADAKEYEGAPVVVNRISNLRAEMFGLTDEYVESKKYFNNLMLERETELAGNVRNAENPLLLTIQYAMAGNYIDFGAMNHVDENQLNQILENAENISVSSAEYDTFVSELQACHSLVYLTDNCGEIVMDKLLMQTIRRLFPHITITAIVRGGYVLNDATMEDAVQVGLPDCVTTIHNGNNIAGTWQPALSENAQAAINDADVIISKGQANYETLRYCGKNIYYLFLCKCEMLAKDCGVPRLTGMFINDRRLTPYQN